MLLSLHLIRVRTFCSKCTAFRWCWVVHPSHITLDACILKSRRPCVDWKCPSRIQQLVDQPAKANQVQQQTLLSPKLSRNEKAQPRVTKNKHLGSDRLPLNQWSKIRPKNIPNSICSRDALWIFFSFCCCSGLLESCEKGFMIKRNGQNATTKLAHLNNVWSKTITVFNTRHTFAEWTVVKVYRESTNLYMDRTKLCNTSSSSCVLCAYVNNDSVLHYAKYICSSLPEFEL